MSDKKDALFITQDGTLQKIIPFSSLETMVDRQNIILYQISKELEQTNLILKELTRVIKDK